MQWLTHLGLWPPGHEEVGHNIPGEEDDDDKEGDGASLHGLLPTATATAALSSITSAIITVHKV